MDDGAAIGLEDELSRISVALVLRDRVVGALARQVVLELHSDDWDAVKEQHDIDGVVIVDTLERAIAELAHDFEAICLPELSRIGVLVGYGLKEAQLK